MRVRTARLWRAVHGVGISHWQNMLVNVILVRMMEMTIVEIIDMAIMADRRVPAVRTMLVGMVGMMLLGAGGHSIFLLHLRSGRTDVVAPRHQHRGRFATWPLGDMNKRMVEKIGIKRQEVPARPFDARSND
jgi:uncharacterized protein YjiS (DUF1127 family)